MICRKYVVTFASNSTKIHFSRHAPGRALDALENFYELCPCSAIPGGYHDDWLRSAYSPENSEELRRTWLPCYKVTTISRTHCRTLINSDLLCISSIMGKDDLEKADVHSTSTDLAPNDNGWAHETKSGSKLSRMRDSFKRNPNARMVTEAVDAEGRPLPDQPAAQPALSMALKGRHLQMIAIGGSIGA
jgi:hypothetical protein